MLNTSQAYKDMMTKPVLESRMEIVVTNGSQSMTLVNKDILRQSVSKNSRATNNDTFSLGTCYASSFNFSAFKDMDTEVEGNYITITPTVYYKLPGNQEERIDLGVFRCDNPVNYAKTTAYECYDLMLAMDKRIESRFSGTPFNVLAFMCEKCGVVLGNTSQQISMMANASQTLVIDPNSIRNYRDALSYVSIILGGFAVFKSDGKLYVQQFHSTSDFTLIKKRRTSSSFAGYKTMFRGVKCRFLAEQNYYPYEYVDEEKDEGIIVDLGDIPIIEGTVSQKQAVLENIYDEIADLEYYPCSITMVGDPSLEVGDMISTPDREGYLKNILLTSVTWVWRQESSIVSEGSDPKADSVNTQTKKTNSKIESSSAQNAVITATYVNADQITIDNSDQETITMLRFVTNKSLTAIFGAEIPLYSDGEGYVDIEYSDSGVIGDTVRARVHQGYNLITLVNHLYYDANKIVNLFLKAQTSAIGSNPAPEIIIQSDSIRSYIFAQGIEIEVPWDGIIIIEENVQVVETVMQLQGLTEQVSVTTSPNIENQFSAVINELDTLVQTQSISATIQVNLTYGEHILKCGHYNRCGNGRQFAPSGGA